MEHWLLRTDRQRLRNVIIFLKGTVVFDITIIRPETNILIFISNLKLTKNLKTAVVEVCVGGGSNVI